MSDVPQPGRARGLGPVLVLLLVGAVLIPVLLVGGFAHYLKVSGTPLIDEWACSDGEAPYVFPDGGSACAKVGSDLPEGATWDPLGNRPLSCHDRWGWTEVEPTEQDPDDPETGCVRNGDPVPDGWRAVG